MKQVSFLAGLSSCESSCIKKLDNSLEIGGSGKGWNEAEFSCFNLYIDHVASLSEEEPNLDFSLTAAPLCKLQTPFLSLLAH